jgi:hypothetical protein
MEILKDSQVWWYTPVISEFRSLRQKNDKSGPAWVTQQDSVSLPKKKQKQKRNLRSQTI